MEAILNLVWALLAAAIVCLWLPGAPRNRAPWRIQAATMAMLILILFPVISVTDDIQSLQNPAETDTCQRRDHSASCPHSIFPTVAALPVLEFPAPALSIQRFSSCLHPRFSTVPNPALNSIQNRPPPAA
jgi:hypothetical protein